MAKITDIIEEQGGEDNFVPPHKQQGAAVEKFAELASTGREDSLPFKTARAVASAQATPDEGMNEAQLRESLIDTHGLSEEEAEAFIQADRERGGYEIEEAQAAIGVRYNEADDLAEQVYRGQLDAEGQPPEVLAKVDARGADDKRRADNETITGTMDKRTDGLLAKATDVVGDIAEGAADMVRGVERSGWKQTLPLKIDNAADTPETRLADEFYKYLAENKYFNKLGAISPEELANYIPTYLEEISRGDSTKATRLKWFDMVTRGIATRNGLSVMDMHLPQGLLEDGTAIDDLASGLTIYQKQSDGRIPTIRQNSQGEVIPFTDDQLKQIDSELEASGVYDPLVRSQYRAGYSKKKIESLSGLSYAWNWVDQARGYAFNKMGVGLETRHTDTSAAMAGEILPIIMGGLVGGAPLAAVKGITQLGRLGTLVKVAAFENSMAVTEYYMAKKGDRQQSLEGAIQSMNLSEVEKEEMGSWAFLHPVLKYVDAYAKDSQFVITGDDDADTAALKHMGSGLKAGALLTPIGFGVAVARMALRPVVKKGATVAVKGIKLSEDAIRRAAKELGLSADDAVRAFKMTGGADPQRGAVGGGKLPQFGRGADEGVARAGEEGFLSFPNPHDLLKKAKSFLENLKAVRTKRKNAELEADIKNTEEIIEQLEPSAGQVDSATYTSANNWNKALMQRIEAEKHLEELDGLPSEARIAELAEKHGTEVDLGKLKRELKRKKNAATSAEKSRRAEFEESHNINLDDWGDTSKEGALPRYDKAKDEGIKLRDWLEDQGEETIDGRIGGDSGVMDEADPIRKALFDEHLQKKKNAQKAFLRALNNYKNARILGVAPKKESSRLEFYFVKLQQVMAEGDDLLDVGTRKGVFTQSYTTPKLKDDEALFKWSGRGYASGNLSARQIYNNANGYRKGAEFAGEYGTEATDALEHHLNNTRMFKNRDIRGTGGRAVMATLRMAKVGSLVSSAGANIASMMGLPVVLARIPLQVGVETAISHLPRNPWTDFVNDARAIRQSTPEKKYAERIGRLEIDENDGTSHKFWEDALHLFFNPTSRRNIDLGGSRATGEYAAGYTGTLEVFGRKSDIQSSSPMAIGAMTTENRWYRNIKTALAGLWELFPREVMQRIDRATKALNFEREFSRQISSAFHEAVGNTSRVKNGTLVNDKQVFEIYHVMLDAKKAIEKGELEEHHMRKFLMDNLSHVYDDAPKGQIHSGYSNEELIDVSMKAWNQTLDRQRELTLQQNLPLYGLGRTFEKATQDPYTGHFIMFGKTLGNNFSMGMERVPFFGAAWDIWGRKGGLKSMGKAQSLEVLEKQLVGGAMWGLGALVYNKFPDRFEIDKDGDLLITVNVSYETIRENLRMNLEENPDQLAEMMDAHNLRMTKLNEVHGMSTPLHDDPYRFLEEVALGMVMPISEGEQGRAVIKAPRLGWLFTGVTSSIAFYKGMGSVDHLPLRVIREQGYGDKIYDSIALGFKQQGSSEIMDGAKKMAAMLTADEQTTVASVTDMVMGELASTTTPWAGAQKTGGEPLETVSELSRDYRAVGGLEEFMESGGKISMPSLMNYAFGDDHISKAYTGMMINKQRSQREASSALLVEYKYETHFIDKQLRESGVVVRSIMDNELLKGAKDIKTYDYRDDEGKTAYEEILDMAHGVVMVNPNDASETWSYEVAMRKFFADPVFKKLQGAIDAGIQIEKDKVDYRDSTGAITNKDMLTALAAQEILHTRVIKIRNAFKDVAVNQFMAEGKMETFKHKGNGASLGTQYSKVVAADFAGKIGLAEAFGSTRNFGGMSVKDLQGFIQDSQTEQANAFAEFYMMQFE